MRHLAFVLLVASGSLFAASAHAQTSCDAEDFQNTCEDTVLEYCDASSMMTATFDCAQAGATCGDPPCSSGCTNSVSDCLAQVNGPCQIQAPVIQGNYLLCDSGLVCQYSSGGLFNESCVAWDGPTCGGTVDGVGCQGNIATRCLSNTRGFAYQYPNTANCDAFNSTCAVGENGFSVCYGGDGATCDDLTLRPFSLLWCQPGFECQGANADTSGTCVPVADAGPDADGGVTTDAGSFSFPDAGQQNPDAGQSVDGGQSTDGGQNVIDAGGNIDGGQSVDAGQPGTDAGNDPPVGVDGSVFGECSGGVTALGECDGDTLRYCQAGVVETVDCAASDRVCVEVGPTAGFNCVRPDDAPPPAGEPPPQSLFFLCRCATPGDAMPPSLLVLAALGLTFVRRRRRR